GAIRGGRRPGRAGRARARPARQYELALHAETLAVTGAKLPPSEAEEDRARLEERVDFLRHMLETLDLMYDLFGRRRLGESWSKDLGRIQRWLAREERERLSASG